MTHDGRWDELYLSGLALAAAAWLYWTKLRPEMRAERPEGQK